MTTEKPGMQEFEARCVCGDKYGSHNNDGRCLACHRCEHFTIPPSKPPEYRETASLTGRWAAGTFDPLHSPDVGVDWGSGESSSMFTCGECGLEEGAGHAPTCPSVVRAAAAHTVGRPHRPELAETALLQEIERLKEEAARWQQTVSRSWAQAESDAKLLADYRTVVGALTNEDLTHPQTGVTLKVLMSLNPDAIAAHRRIVEAEKGKP